MAFKMKGPTFFNVGKKGQYEKSAAFQHYVDDNREHNDPEHSDDLQTEEEHKTGKVKKSTESAHGQLNDADIEYQEDRKYYNSLVKKEKNGTITKSEQNALDRLKAEEG